MLSEPQPREMGPRGAREGDGLDNWGAHHAGASLGVMEEKSTGEMGA